MLNLYVFTLTSILFINLYCLPLCEGSPDANASLTPGISLTMKGGSPFPVYDPIIVISTEVACCFCCVACVISLRCSKYFP